MKNRSIRTATIIATTLAAATGTALSATSAAQAVVVPHYNSAWTCTALTIRDPGEIYGRSCYGFGTNPGWYYLTTSSGVVQEYRCATFGHVDGFPGPFPNPDYNERGTGCIYVGPSPYVVT